MLSLTSKLPNVFIISGHELKVNLAFDNVLKFYELMESNDFSENEKLLLSFNIIFPEAEEVELDSYERLEAIQKVIAYINHNPYENISEESESMNNDELEGDEEEQTAASFSFIKDAALIYVSFMRDYKIDLIEQQGSLRWEKFNAMLNYLSDDTPFKQIIAIRNKSLQGLEGTELSDTIELQDRYSLQTAEERQAQAMARMSDSLSFLQGLAK